MTREILVLGAGSFIGTHLVRRHSTEGSRIHLKHGPGSLPGIKVSVTRWRKR